MEKTARLFFQNEPLKIIKDFNEVEQPYILTSVNQENNIYTISVEYMDSNINDKAVKTITDSINVTDNEKERIMAVEMYNVLTKVTGETLKWGILTGVRPVKLFRSFINSSDILKAKEKFLNDYMVSDEKTNLTIETEINENKILNLSKNNSFSLYISIPFCPTRCSYCSFVSQSIEKSVNLIQPYFEKLCKEIIYTSKIVKKLNLKLESVYIGGGTPTTLNAEHLGELIEVIKNNFDVDNCREFTIEAGRPDTINEEKLRSIYNGGVDRISINPQTFKNKTLELIGRMHTTKQTINAYNLARKIGFKHINMDLIIGLPNESVEDFKNSLNKVIDMKPESVTIHTLSVKKTSYMNGNGKIIKNDEVLTVNKMHSYAMKTLKATNYKPYYMYRQSKMIGNLENVGWSLDGKEGIYNVYVMDETHTIIGCGAGAVTKLKEPNANKLERIFNYKLPYEYINQFDEMIKRKSRILDFYSKVNR